MWGQMYRQVPGRLFVFTSTKRFYRKGTEEPEITKTQNEHEKKSRYFKAVSTVRGTFWAISSVGGTVLAVSSLDTFWRYPVWIPFGGIESWRYSFGGTESWRYFLAVSRVGGTFFGGSGKTKTWRYFFGGNAIRR